MIALYCVAGVAELFGLFLAFHGLQRTWAEYMPAESLGSAFIRLTSSPVKRFGRSAQGRIRRVLRLRGGTTIVGAASVASASMVGTARARVGWGPLPSMGNDSLGFAAEVQSRLRRLQGSVQDAHDSIADERAERERMLADLEERITHHVAALANQTKSIATDGILEQLCGWFLIVTGVVLGTVGNVLQAL